MVQVVIYMMNYCPYCTVAKALLRSKNVRFDEVDVISDPLRRAEMEQLSQRRIVLQIFIDGMLIGGYDEVSDLNASGELDRMLGI